MTNLNGALLVATEFYLHLFQAPDPMWGAMLALLTLLVAIVVMYKSVRCICDGTIAWPFGVLEGQGHGLTPSEKASPRSPMCQDALTREAIMIKVDFQG